MKTICTNFFERVPSNINQSDKSFFLFCNYVYIYAFFAHIIFVPIFYMLGNTTVFTINIIAILLDVFCLLLNYKGFLRFATFIWVCEVVVHSSYCIIVFGWEHGYYYYFLSLVIIVFFSRWHISLRLIGALLLFLISVILFHYSYTHPPITQIGDNTLFFIHTSNAMANFVALAYASFYYRRVSNQMEKQLLKLANTDVLTGIANRRSFEKSVGDELKKHDRNRRECALILLDIDHFKKINDSFGHGIGDMALQKVVEVSQRSLRETDIFGRIGGEEFAIFLIKTEYKKAVQIAEEIRKNIEDNKMYVDSGAEILLSVSIGITISKTTNENLSSLMERSDQALYQAKNTGRNRVASIL